jgi:hypothetical protein
MKSTKDKLELNFEYLVITIPDSFSKFEMTDSIRGILEGKTFFAEAVFEYQDGSFKKISDKEAPVLELMHR